MRTECGALTMVGPQRSARLSGLRVLQSGEALPSRSWKGAWGRPAREESGCSHKEPVIHVDMAEERFRADIVSGDRKWYAHG
jgi:hypothetical protein